MNQTAQLSYYYKHRAERSLYAKQYYRAKKLQTGGEKKVRKKYRTWKSNQALIDEHKQYIIDNNIKTVSISFFT